MKQETLKKIVELADGFKWRTQESKSTSTKDGTNKEWTDNFIDYGYHGILVIETDDITIWHIYPLLLRRAVEGWNRKHLINYDIIFDGTCLVFRTKDDKCPILFYYKYQKTDYLTPQEQAIEACLIELLER